MLSIISSGIIDLFFFFLATMFAFVLFVSFGQKTQLLYGPALLCLKINMNNHGKTKEFCICLIEIKLKVYSTFIVLILGFLFLSECQTLKRRLTKCQPNHLFFLDWNGLFFCNSSDFILIVVTLIYTVG